MYDILWICGHVCIVFLYIWTTCYTIPARGYCRYLILDTGIMQFLIIYQITHIALLFLSFALWQFSPLTFHTFHDPPIYIIFRLQVIWFGCVVECCPGQVSQCFFLCRYFRTILTHFSRKWMHMCAHLYGMNIDQEHCFGHPPRMLLQWICHKGLLWKKNF